MSAEFGFFLDPGRFRNAVFGTGEPTSTALLNVAHLWGARLSGSRNCAAYAPAILSLSIRVASENLASSQPQNILHGIQVEVLLAYYFFADARILESKYHMNAALSLALSSGLSKIRTPPRFDQATRIIVPSETGVLPPPRDSTEEGERINAFWTVLTLNNALAATDGSPSSISYSAPGMRIDTPWPLELKDYNEVGVPLPLRSFLRLRRVPRPAHISVRATKPRHCTGPTGECT